MRRTDWLKLDVIPEVLDFLDTVPDLSNACLESKAALDKLFNHTYTLDGLKQDAREELMLAGEERDGIALPLRVLVIQVMRLASAAAAREGNPDIRPNLNLQSLRQIIPISSVRLVLETAARHRAVLLRYGMPEALLDRLWQEVERYGAALERRAAASVAFATANADLEKAAREAHLLIRHLDALIRIRLADEPERLAEWRRVRAIPWPGRATQREAESGTRASTDQRAR